MKTAQDLYTRFQNELNQWFPRQCGNPFEKFYLYYLESTPDHDGGIIISKDTPGNDQYRLATPEAMQRGMTVEQNFYHFQTILNRLPVLSIREEVPA